MIKMCIRLFYIGHNGIKWVTYKVVNCNLLHHDLVNYDLVNRN